MDWCDSQKVSWQRRLHFEGSSVCRENLWTRIVTM